MPWRKMDAKVESWLLEGDPAIRWQVLQELLEADQAAVAAERARVAQEGWGAQLLPSRWNTFRSLRVLRWADDVTRERA